MFEHGITTPISLDVTTLFIVATCVTALLGVFLLFAWSQDRIRALAWWGAHPQRPVTRRQLDTDGVRQLDGAVSPVVDRRGALETESGEVEAVGDDLSLGGGVDGDHVGPDLAVTGRRGGGPREPLAARLRR